MTIVNDLANASQSLVNRCAELLQERDALQAQRDELLSVLRDCFTSDGATAFVHPRYAPQRLRAINELVQGAIARATQGGTGQ